MADNLSGVQRERFDCGDCDFWTTTLGDLMKHKREERHMKRQTAISKKKDGEPNGPKIKGSGPLHGGQSYYLESVQMLGARDEAGMGEEPSKLVVEEPKVDVKQQPNVAVVDGTQYKGQKWFSTAELTDKSGLDDKVVERLRQMVPSVIENISGNISVAASHRRRLLNRLKTYDLIEIEVDGDGNCQFRALSDQIYGTSEHHEFVRKQIVNQLKSHQEMYQSFVDVDYGDYLEDMSKSGYWGDNLTLKAAADLFRVKIFLITSHNDICYYEFDPEDQHSNRVMCLSFRDIDGAQHYNSVYYRGEVNIKEDPPDDQVPIKCENNSIEEATSAKISVLVAPTSWKSCCGLLDVLLGSRET